MRVLSEAIVAVPVTDFHAFFELPKRLIEGEKAVSRDKREIPDLAPKALSAPGHVRLEGRQFVGKTTLFPVLTNTLGLGFPQIQPTSDADKVNP